MAKVTRQDILKLIVEGNTPPDIVALLREQGISSPAKRLAAAFDHLKRTASIPDDVTKAWAREAYRECYRRLLASGDYAGAVRALNSILKLSPGLETEADDDVSTMTEKELRAELAEESP
ncbi:hypothetical protein CMI37_37785 [Candidatus Pacearchaeota archaeon]|nr:hypothetical protein [Candidatus Pacearchaeota archaeon]